MISMDKWQILILIVVWFFLGFGVGRTYEKTKHELLTQVYQGGSGGTMVPGKIIVIKAGVKN